MKDSPGGDSVSQQAVLHGLIIGRWLFNRPRLCQIYSITSGPCRLGHENYRSAGAYTSTRTRATVA